MRRHGLVLELLRAFRVTIVVFVAVAAVTYVKHDVVAACLARMDPFRHAWSKEQLPALFWLVIATRLAVFASMVPLAAEGWLWACRVRSAPAPMRLWPVFCLATVVALTGALVLTRHLAGELSHSLVYYFGDSRAD